MIEEFVPKQYILWLNKIAHVILLLAAAVRTGTCGGGVPPGS